ncbi:MAG: hypothetical protein NWQ31_06340 [Polaribacter sp.]|nr:hypothetical protein [Polaribacter sp.]
MKAPIKLSILVCFFVITSCYESLDFNQIDDYVSKPEITSALTYFAVKPAQFYDSNGNQKYNITDVTNFYGLQNTYIHDNLVKINVNAEIINQFDREVTLQVDFLSSNNTVVYSFTPIIVEKGNLNYTYLEEIDLASQPLILNTSKIRISASIENTGVPLNVNDTSQFVFKSSVTLFIEASI